MRNSLFVIFSTALATFALACTKTTNDAPTAPVSSTAPAGSTAPEPRPAPPATATLSDPQIAAIVVAANQVDIDTSTLALQKSRNEEVKKFAQQMVTDHTAVNNAAIDLVTKLKVTPEESDASKALTSNGAKTMAKLQKLDGDAFDRAYIDNEVAYHKAVIDVVDRQLIPAASNPELKSTLVGVRPLFDAHLKHAEQIQAALSGPVSARAADHGLGQ